jgi:hypothetical protein
MSRAKGATLKPFSSAKAMKPDRLGGGVRYECQLTAGTAIGHDVAAADITAELDVHLLDHAFMMAGGTGLRQPQRAVGTSAYPELQRSYERRYVPTFSIASRGSGRGYEVVLCG